MMKLPRRRWTDRNHREGYFNREEICMRWGCTIGKIINLEHQGHLKRAPADLGAAPNAPAYYVEADILMLEERGFHKRDARRINAKIRNVATLQRRAFAMFAINATISEVVEQLRISYQTAEELYEVYRDNNFERRYRMRALEAAAKIKE